MNRSKLVLALWLGTNAWAQTSPQKPVTPPIAATPPVSARSPVLTKPGVVVRVQSRNAPAKPLPLTLKPAAVKHMATIPATKAPAKQQIRRRKAVQPHPTGTFLATDAKPRAGKAQRDPFVSPVVERVRDGAPCTGTGRQCLLVSDVSLRGVVRSQGAFIAVVVNGEHTYFLRENDPLADGAVERITKDAIILREHSSDSLGRPLTHEVTKKVGVVPAV